MSAADDTGGPGGRAPADEAERANLTRRLFLRNAGSVAAGSVLAGGLLPGCEAAPARTASAPAVPVPAPARANGAERLAGEIDIELDVNGVTHKLRVEPRTTLLNALRNHCTPPLTGTKLVCDRGNCGACTVAVDGRTAYACLLLAADLRGRKIRTIEGHGSPDALSPVQAAFWKHDASMCGFCTPGFVVSITNCLERHPGADLPTIRAACAGNTCRCGTYPHVFAAALEAAQATVKKGRG